MFAPGVFFLYSAGLVLGLVIVSVAAASAVLTGPLGLSPVAYGALFIPFDFFAAAGAIGGGGWAHRLGLRRLLVLALLAAAGSQGALAAASAFPGAAGALAFVAASLVGLAAGLSAAPMNTWPQVMFPRHRDAAVVMIHTLMTLGLAGGPLLVAAALGLGHFALAPLVLLVACLVFMALTSRQNLPATPAHAHSTSAQAARPVRRLTFWLFLATTFLYAVSEAALANWGVLFVEVEKGFPAATASLALAAFWAALSLGRASSSLLFRWVSAQQLWLVLPAFVAGALLLLPRAQTPAQVLAGFALAGLACSAHYPLTMSLASARFPTHVAWTTGMLFAANATGAGVGSALLGWLYATHSLSQLYRLAAMASMVALVMGIWLVARRPSATASS